MSFLPNSGVDIELSNESKQKIRKRSDYKIRVKFSEDNGKRLDKIINIKYLFTRNIQNKQIMLFNICFHKNS